jgi:cytochrome c553
MISLTVIGLLLPLAASQEPAADPDGQAIYTQSCALCHGEKGDGNGAAKFDPPARSFVNGGYSFGNTPNAVFNTISNGIGGTAMPAFQGQLTEAEIKAVATLVIGFAPQEEISDPLAAVLQVSERPQIIRGGLNAYHKENTVIPRALVLGGLDGLSVELDTATMGVLAFRRGDFVQRNDWGDRGGAMLEPMGELLMSNTENGNSWGLFSASGFRDAKFKFVATEVSEQKAKVVYRIIDSENSVEVAEVVEYFEIAKERYTDADFVVNQQILITWLAECDASLLYGASYEAPTGWRVGRGLRLDQTELGRSFSFLYQYAQVKAASLSESQHSEYDHE